MDSKRTSWVPKRAHSALALLIVASLSACTTGGRSDIQVSDNFPPIGLAASAVWLEDRQVALPRVRAASDVPTSEIRSVVGGRAPVASGTPPAPVPVAQRTALSNDDILNSLVSSFRAGCLNNAPGFDTASARKAFQANPPSLAPGMTYLSTGRPRQSCNVSVQGYGTSRPRLTRSDVVLLTQELQQRLGGDVVVSNRNPESASARLRVGRTTYRLSSFVSRQGRFSLSVSK
ncbi:hypothetical protein [uncultured Tateyamaria sp.]|uniref:hypothetical protein n=1 Tax=uncultured Tateyamaria sp. TaxID=455651 RepID=UPI0026208745|nr:hypothetical protein [uncultured Tateyamaria sp.]